MKEVTIKRRLNPNNERPEGFNSGCCSYFSIKSIISNLKTDPTTEIKSQARNQKFQKPDTTPSSDLPRGPKIFNTVCEGKIEAAKGNRTSGRSLLVLVFWLIFATFYQISLCNFFLSDVRYIQSYI